MRSSEKRRTLLGQLADMMPRDPTEQDVLERALWIARELVVCDSAVLLEHEGGRFVPHTFRSPEAERLKTAKLGITEPVVSDAFCGGDLVCAEENLFFTDEIGMACPIKGFGVFYMGRRTNEPFSEEEMESLVICCQYANLGLENARLYARNMAPRLHEAVLQLSVAQQMLSSFSAISEAVTALMEISHPEELLQEAGKQLHKLADVQHWGVFVNHKEVRNLYDSGGVDTEIVARISEDVIGSRKPVALLNMQRSSYGLPAATTRACYIALMRGEGKVIGCLFMATDRQRFTIQEQQIVSTYALNVGSYYWTLRLHQNLKESQAQLVHSSKMAAVGQLAAGVAHELNTPLGAIKMAVSGALKAIVKLNKPERAVARLERSVGSVDQLKQIISRLLHYSGKRPTEGLSDLNKVVHDSLALIGHQLKMDGVKVETGLLEELPPVDADTNELQQVLINLLTNARDAVLSSEQEKRLIRVGTLTRGKYVELTVEDNGIGMDQDTVKRVFEPFYTTKDVGKGTGLGLSVSREILDRYQGTVKVESVVGLGTKFLLCFPISNSLHQGEQNER